MSQGYDNTNSGVLFKNDRKEKPNQPDNTGNLNTTCPHCGKETIWWLSAWIKTAKQGGRRFFSIAVNPKDEQKPASQAEGPPGGQEDFDDDIPF